MFYVDITDVEDNRLEFIGFRLAFEDDIVKIYEDYYGDEYIVAKTGRKFIKVDDFNTATALGSSGFELKRQK